MSLQSIIDTARRATPGEWSWMQDRGALWTYVDGRNQEIIWPTNVPSGEPDSENGEEDPATGAWVWKWSVALGACGMNAEERAEANAAHIANTCPARILPILEALQALIEAAEPFAKAYEFWSGADGGIADSNEMDDQGLVKAGDFRNLASAMAGVRKAVER